MQEFRQHTVQIADQTLSFREVGTRDAPTFVFLHGWPESGRSFEPLMTELAENFRSIAFDLPGIGDSHGPLLSGDKKEIAEIIHEAIRRLEASSVILVGHDCGGMVAYSFLRKYGAELSGACILNTVIPGIDPWERIISNPDIWHFAFHSIPSLPETLVAGRQRPYFDYFFDLLSHRKSSIDEALREAFVSDYSRSEALTTGFCWYRAFEDDAKQNAVKILSGTHVLYVRGDREGGDINDYVRGLQNSGIQYVNSAIVHDCGHFSPLEAPERLAQILKRFATEQATQASP